MGFQSIYQSLGHEKSIRLLRIESGEDGEDIKCSLEVHEDLQHVPAFEALSYVWGNVRSDSDILCNGISTSVTANLHHALRRLRPRTNHTPVTSKPKGNKQQTPLPTLTDLGDQGISEGLVWIDALCINQRDPLERGRQVGMMGDIFKQAKRVIIWLGSEDGFMPTAAGLLTKLSALGPASRKLRHGTVYGYWNKDSSVLSEKGLPEKAAPEWTSLKDFFMVSWFTRLWVIQEFALASAVGMYIGRYQINAEVLERAICNFSKYGFFDVLDEKTQSAYWAIDDMFRKDHIWRIRTGKKAKALWDILPQCIWFHCLDPRDRIFALLSLTQEGSSGQIPRLVYPDYTKSLDEVYRDATRYCLASTQKLQCLGYATPAADERKQFSWAMNLESDLVLTQVCWGNNAAFDSSAIVEDGEDPASLCLHGFDITVISGVSPQITDPKVEPQNKFNAINAFLDCANLVELRPSSTVQQNATDVAHALMAGWIPFLRKLNDKTQFGTKLLAERLGTFLSRTVFELDSDDNVDVEHLLWWSRTRRLFVTTDGRMGLGPPDLDVGDEVKCLLGGPVLHVLRPQDGCFAYVGDCAMHGLMDGQSVQAVLGDRELQSIPTVNESAEQNRRAKVSQCLKAEGLTSVYVIR